MSDIEDTVILREQSLHAYSSIVLGQRKDQQDSLNIMKKDDHTTLCIIADGMGGLQGGQLASSLAVNTFCGHFMDDPIDHVSSFLYNQAIECDHMIADLEDSKGNPLQAGSTLVAAYVHDDELNFVSVGDSRLYLFRNNELVQVTKDHNYFMILKEAKDNMSEEIYNEELKKGDSLVSYLGMDGLKYIEISKEPIKLQPQDYLLMCSDGLYKRLNHEQLTAVMMDVPFVGIERTVKTLQDEAAMAKGRKQDNTSVIVAGYY